jgi:hypothetical protein
MATEVRLDDWVVEYVGIDNGAIKFCIWLRERPLKRVNFAVSLLTLSQAHDPAGIMKLAIAGMKGIYNRSNDMKIPPAFTVHMQG